MTEKDEIDSKARKTAGKNPAARGMAERCAEQQRQSRLQSACTKLKGLANKITPGDKASNVAKNIASRYKHENPQTLEEIMEDLMARILEAMASKANSKYGTVLGPLKGAFDRYQKNKEAKKAIAAELAEEGPENQSPNPKPPEDEAHNGELDRVLDTVEELPEAEVLDEAVNKAELGEGEEAAPDGLDESGEPGESNEEGSGYTR